MATLNLYTITVNYVLCTCTPQKKMKKISWHQKKIALYSLSYLMCLWDHLVLPHHLVKLYPGLLSKPFTTPPLHLFTYTCIYCKLGSTYEREREIIHCFYFLIFYLFSINFTSCIPFPLISLSLHSHPSPLQLSTPQKRNSPPKTPKPIQPNQKPSLCGSYDVSQCPTVYPFIHNSLLINIHRNKSLVWVSASDFCCTTNTGSSQELLLDILLLAHVSDVLQFWFCRTSPFIGSSSS